MCLKHGLFLLFSSITILLGSSLIITLKYSPSTGHQSLIARDEWESSDGSLEVPV